MNKMHFEGKEWNECLKTNGIMNRKDILVRAVPLNLAGSHHHHPCSRHLNQLNGLERDVFITDYFAQSLIQGRSRASTSKPICSPPVPWSVCLSFGWGLRCGGSNPVSFCERIWLLSWLRVAVSWELFESIVLGKRCGTSFHKLETSHSSLAGQTFPSKGLVGDRWHLCSHFSCKQLSSA